MSIHPKFVARVLMICLLFGFLVGDLLTFNLTKIWPVVITILFCLLMIILIFRINLITLAAAGGIFFFLVIVFTNHLNARFVPPAAFKDQTEISGLVSERPQLDDKQKVVLQVENYKILINLPRYPEYHYGQILKVAGKLETPTVFPDFNYQNYLKGKQIYLVINKTESVEVAGEAGSIIKSWLYKVADKFEAALNKSLPEPESSFAAGLLLGSKRGLPDTLITQMQNSGTSHLVAISGYNITIIIIALSYLLMPLGRKAGFVASLIMIIGFVILTGGAASVVRGAIVGLLAIFAKIIDRRANQTNILLLSAILILALNPLMLLYDFGFLLSFSAFAGLIYISPLLSHLFRKDRQLKRLPEFIQNPLKETLSAQVMSLPLLLFAFGKFSIVAPLANVLVLPLIPSAMVLTLFVGLFGIINGLAGTVAGYISWVLLKYPLLVIEYFGNLKFAAVDFGKNWLWLVVVLYFIIGVLIISKRKLRELHGQSLL